MSARALSYAVVTPARNEAENLERLAGCLVAQTVLPEVWVVVDSGSNDGTPVVASDLVGRHDWIRLEQLEAKGEMARGAPVVRAFHRGLEHVGSPDVVVKLDADVSFGRDFFERLLREFQVEPRLGIAQNVAASWEQSGSKPSAVNALRKLVEFIGESVQSAASGFDVCPIGKSPHKGRVVGIAQSAFFRLSRHGCEPFLLRTTGPQSAMFLNRGSVGVGLLPESGLRIPGFDQHSRCVPRPDR